MFYYFEDNAGVIVNLKGEMKGSAITGPVGIIIIIILLRKGMCRCLAKDCLCFRLNYMTLITLKFMFYFKIK